MTGHDWVHYDFACIKTIYFGKDGSQIITAPANYDGDDPEFKEYELSETLVDTPEFYLWTYNVDQSDVESNYAKLTESQTINIIKNGSAIGFVWYNESA